MSKVPGAKSLRVITKTSARARDSRGSRRRPKGKHFAAAERRQGVNEHEVHLPLQTHVLKAIVQDQDVAAEAFFEQPPGLVAVRTDAHRGNSRAQENLRFVAGLRGLYVRSRLPE